MLTPDQNLSPNDLAFIALCKEYNETLFKAPSIEKDDFIQKILRLLPRIYISASDIRPSLYEEPGDCIDSLMDQSLYDSVRNPIATLLGEDDTYLEVFQEDMKYSDTPIGASISEGLTDIMQVTYNLVETVRDLPTEMIPAALIEAREDFNGYWSQTLCNVMRPLNQLYYQIQQP